MDSIIVGVGSNSVGSASDDAWSIVAVTAVASSVPAAEAVAADATAEGGSSDRRDRRCMPPLRRPRWRQKTRCYRVLSDKGHPNTREKTEAEITRGYRPIPAVRYIIIITLHQIVYH